MKLAGLILFAGIMTATAQENYNLVIGTYTNSCQSNGIYVYDFNTATADVKLKASSSSVVSPSFLALSPDKKFIYSVNENGKDSEVSAFKFTAATGKIEAINRKDSKGDDPCYIINDSKNVIVANYSGGSVAVFGKNANGGLTDAKQVIKHSGKSIDPQRQEAAHVHLVYFSPDKKHVFCNDLGEDKTYIYSYSPDGGSKTLVLKSIIDAKPGSGPRHLAFHPNGIFFYVLNELDASLVAYSYINEKVEKIQELSTVASDFTGKIGAGDIHFSRDGKYLYTTNRGDANTISAFRVHANGMVNMVQQLLTEGDSPRNFAIDPKDNYVLIGLQKSNNVTIFKRNKTTGMLEDTCKRIDLCAPVCLVFTDAK